jgi:hypothetical protein
MAMQQEPIDWRYLPYIFGLLFRPIFQGISPQNMAKNIVLTYLHQLDPEIPIDHC